MTDAFELTFSRLPSVFKEKWPIKNVAPSQQIMLASKQKSEKKFKLFVFPV